MPSLFGWAPDTGRAGRLKGLFPQKKEDIQEDGEYKDSAEKQNQENGQNGDFRTEEQKRQPEVSKQKNGRSKAEKNPTRERKPRTKPVKQNHHLPLHDQP